VTDFEISSVDKEDLPNHQHVLDVGLRGLISTYNVQSIYASLDAGDTYHTGNRATGNYAQVSKFTCNACGQATLRSYLRNQWSNNLDNLQSSR
jgi:20S proteasome alpha/beta subunit